MPLADRSGHDIALRIFRVSSVRRRGLELFDDDRLWLMSAVTFEFILSRS